MLAVMVCMKGNDFPLLSLDGVPVARSTKQGYQRFMKTNYLLLLSHSFQIKLYTLGMKRILKFFKNEKQYGNVNILLLP